MALGPAAPRLVPGSSVGPYRIERLLGVGGMGEVYCARDTRLDRDVAIKTLPSAFAADEGRVSRFEREAKVLALLNHSGIASIYGLEDVNGGKALVMELVDGDDLGVCLARGALPLDEALTIARQIAEALEAAHDQGIIHRDLKPANIKVRPDGMVKVLDFGLAKAFDSPGSMPTGATVTMLSMQTTRPGAVIGTAAYMPPEQARGKPVDRRADLWSFGCVLFEMLTGRPPFQGETVSDVLAKIIERDPDWNQLQAATPPAIHRLLRRCLEKDPKRRIDSAAVARLEIEEASASPRDDLAAASRRGNRPRLAALGAAAVLAAIGGAAATWALVHSARPPSDHVSRFAITLPPAQALAFSINDRDVALSADGRLLAYTAGDRAQLMLRALDKLEAATVAGIENARAPFLSPDGHWVGFFDRLDEGVTTGSVVRRGALKKVSIAGGPPVVLCALTGASRGASWGADDLIVFATSDPSTGLLRVAASGGEPEVLTRPDAAKGERGHAYPSVLPGGRGVLYTITRRGANDSQVAVLDLKTRQQKTLIRSGGQAEYIETGHLLYSQGGALWAVRFDLAALDVVGDPVPLEQTLMLGAADFAISRRGTLAYVPVGGVETRSLVWVDRQGAETPIAAPAREYIVARLSPDGTQAALQIRDQQAEIWVWQFARERLTRLTFAPPGSASTFPVWEAGGRHVFFGSSRDSSNPERRITSAYRRPADGTGTDERLTNVDNPVRPIAASPDGKLLVLEKLTASAGYDFVVAHLDSARQVEPLLETPSDERNAAISPDGKWMAYESNESGQSQIYIRPFPNVADARYQVSYGGGRTPAWAPDGHEVFFVNRSSLMAAAAQTTPAFSVGNPTKLFDAPTLLLDGRLSGGANTNRNYDISRDGRFLMIKSNAGATDANPSRTVVIVENWFEDVKARVAATVK